jgi:uncharacterized membrane protein
MATLAALAGLTDVIGDPQIRGLNDAWLHAGGNVVAVLISSTISSRVTNAAPQRSCRPGSFSP